MSRRLIRLFLVLATLSLLGVVIHSLQDTEPSSDQERFLPALFEQAANLDAISIRSAQQSLLDAKRVGDRWYAFHSSGEQAFPLDKGELSALVTALAAAQVVETKTAKAENYSRLGVEAITSPDAQSIQVIAQTKDKTWQTLIGNQASNSQGQYVRKPDEKTSYLIDQVINLPLSETDWLDPNWLGMNEQKLTAVQVAGDESWRLEQDGTWSLANMSENETLKYPSIVNQTVSDVLHVEFERVKPASEVVETGLPPFRTWHFFKGDEQQLIYRLYFPPENVEAGVYWLTLSGAAAPAWSKNWVLELSAFQARALIGLRQSLLATPVPVAEANTSSDEQN